MKRIEFRRVFIVAGLVALVLIYSVLWLQMIASPSERTGSDFISAYTGGRVADLWGAANVYNLAYQQAVQEHVVGFDLVSGQVLMFNHPPYMVPLLSLLMSENYVASLIRYALVMVALYAISLTVVWRLLLVNGWKYGQAALALTGMATFYPLFVSLVNTQDTALMVLGGILWLFGLLTGRDWLAGLGLALTTIRPQVTVLLAVPFLFRRQKVFGWFCLGASALGLASFLAVGVDGLKSYIRILLIAAGGDFYGLKEPAMVNLIGLLWRIAPGLGAEIIHWIGWAVYGATLIGLCILWVRSRVIAEKQIGLAVMLSVFAVPHLHYHDLTLLIVPLVAALVVLVRGGFLRERMAALIPLALSMALLFSNFSAILKYNFPYLVMLSLVLALWHPGAIFRYPARPET